MTSTPIPVILALVASTVLYLGTTLVVCLDVGLGEKTDEDQNTIDEEAGNLPSAEINEDTDINQVEAETTDESEDQNAIDEEAGNLPPAETNQDTTTNQAEVETTEEQSDEQSPSEERKPFFPPTISETGARSGSCPFNLLVLTTTIHFVCSQIFNFWLHKKTIDGKDDVALTVISVLAKIEFFLATLFLWLMSLSPTDKENQGTSLRIALGEGFVKLSVAWMACVFQSTQIRLETENREQENEVLLWCQAIFWACALILFLCGDCFKFGAMYANFLIVTALVNAE